MGDDKRGTDEEEETSDNCCRKEGGCPSFDSSPSADCRRTDVVRLGVLGPAGRRGRARNMKWVTRQWGNRDETVHKQLAPITTLLTSKYHPSYTAFKVITSTSQHWTN
jgi:hypothetical protein